MAPSRTWFGEITIEVTHSEPELWADFIARAKVYEGPGFSWATPVLRFGEDVVVVTAFVVAETSERAVQRATTVVSNVGHQVDRIARLDWAGARGSATVYR